jgi:hypothetical protein
MNRQTVVLFSITTLLLFNTPGAFALEPTFEGSGTLAWPSVQGNAHGGATDTAPTDLSRGKSRRERFNDVPAWIVSEDFDNDGKSEAGILFRDGTFRILSLENDRLRTVSTVKKLAPESPPIVLPELGGDSTGGLVGIDDRGDLVTIDNESGRTRRAAGGFSPLTYPVGGDFDGDGTFEVAAVSDEGYFTVVSRRTHSRTESSVELLPDTRIIASDLDGTTGQELIVLTRPTNEKTPGQLGDDLDAKGVAVFSWDGRSANLEDEYTLPDGEVFEMIQPVVIGYTGYDRDGRDRKFLPHIILTVLDDDEKAGLRSYIFENGRIRQRRKGPTVDEDKWVHPLAGALFGDREQLSLAAAVLTDDGEGGDLELYRADLAQTRLTLRGVLRTHQSGSRLVETSLVGDFNRSGELDLIVPGPDMEGVKLITLDGSRLKAREIYNASAQLTTNFCPGDYDGDGNMDVMFGLGLLMGL